MHSLRSSRGPLAVARDRTGRLLTAAGALALGAGALTHDLYPAAMAAAGAATAFGAAWSLTLPQSRARDIATALYLAPALTHAAITTTMRLVPGTHWWEFAAAVLWTGTVWWVRPARLARILVGREPSLAPAAIKEDDQEQQQRAAADAARPIIPAGQHPVLTWWQQHAATATGPATGTTLEDITQPAPGALRATIRATAPGTPVPTISTVALSALMDIPEDDIRIGPVPGRGAGVRRLTVGRTPAAADDLSLADMWAQQIAPKGMPGTVITAVRAVPVHADGTQGAPVDLTKTPEEITP